MSMDDQTDPASDQVDSLMHSAIGDQLRSMYDSVLSEPIPQRLIELLEQLDQASAASAGGGQATKGRK
jgi:hypothetical protein